MFGKVATIEVCGNICVAIKMRLVDVFPIQA